MQWGEREELKELYALFNARVSEGVGAEREALLQVEWPLWWHTGV